MVTLTHFLLLSVVLFTIGVAGVLTRRGVAAATAKIGAAA